MNTKNRIAEIRKKRGLTQSQLAELTDTSTPQIQRLETGNRRLNMDWLEKISKALECEPAELIAPKAKQDPVEKELLNKFRQMPLHQRHTFLKVADAMTDKSKSDYNHDDE